jgi:hypothetical protein
VRRVLVFATALALLPGCPKSLSTGGSGTAASTNSPLQPAPAPWVVVAQSIYDSALASPLTNKWEDYGWAKREVKGPGPARVDFSKYGGWIIAKPSLPDEGTTFGGVTFRVKTPPGEGEFLELRVEMTDSSTFPRIKLSPDQRRDVGDGWSEVVVPMSVLDPDALPFDRIVLRAFRDVPPGWVELDKIALLKGTGAAIPGAPIDPATARPVSLTVDCRAIAKRIDPRIYGIAYDAQRGVDDPAVWKLGATMRRWGGNPTTRYNWELGNAWNTASDWYFENVGIAPYTDFLKADGAHHVKSALTVPTIGWVAKDTTSSGFPVSLFGAEQSTDQYRNGAGNGNGPDGKPLAPKSPTQTSVPAPPEFIRRWVEAIRKADAQSGTRSVDEYILDNETGLWNSTHRDVHPDPVTYDELLEKTIAYGSAIRAADPDAVIAGPASWGWPEYSFSAKDSAVSFTLKPDRRAHGDVPLLAWWLQKLREHEQKTGTRIVDLLDVHFYPQGDHVFGDSKTDPKTAALRIRQTRGLWDPTYKDESWVADTIMLVPRMKKWIAENYPGRGLSIGEYSFGGENHMSGALAEAEALGRFAEQGVSSAFYWTYPKADSPVTQAFRAYRDFDGKGGRFLDFAVPTHPATNGDLSSIFASRDEAGTHLVLVILNLTPDSAARASVVLDGCGAIQSKSAFTYVAGTSALAPVKEAGAPGSSVEELVAPYSITVVDLRLQVPAPGGLEK